MSRQEQELEAALDAARRAAGRAASRARLNEDPALAFVFTERAIQAEHDRLEAFRRTVYELRAAA